jgi:hypothetical protein
VFVVLTGTAGGNRGAVLSRTGLFLLGLCAGQKGGVKFIRNFLVTETSFHSLLLA